MFCQLLGDSWDLLGAQETEVCGAERTTGMGGCWLWQAPSKPLALQLPSSYCAPFSFTDTCLRPPWLHLGGIICLSDKKGLWYLFCHLCPGITFLFQLSNAVRLYVNTHTAGLMGHCRHQQGCIEYSRCLSWLIQCRHIWLLWWTSRGLGCTGDKFGLHWGLLTPSCSFLLLQLWCFLMYF